MLFWKIGIRKFKFSNIDKGKNLGYSNSTRALPVDGSPSGTYKEVTGIWADLAVTSLFLSILFNQGDKCNNEHAKSEKLCPCNHCDHPLAFVWGCQKFTPERGNRLPWHGSPTNRVTLNLPIVNTSAGICRCGVFLPVLLQPLPPGGVFLTPPYEQYGTLYNITDPTNNNLLRQIHASLDFLWTRRGNGGIIKG